MYRKGVGIILLNNNDDVFIAHRHIKRPGTELALSLIAEDDLKKVQKNKILKALDTKGSPSLLDYLWQMPQGGIDKGESPEGAALRELKEETGLHNVQIIGVSKEWFYYDIPWDLIPESVWGEKKVKGQCQKWFLMRFLGQDHDVNLSSDEDEEFDAWRWINPEVLPDIVVPFKRDLYKKILQTFCLKKGLIS